MALSEKEQREYEILKAIQDGRLSEAEGDEMLSLYDSQETEPEWSPAGGKTIQEMPEEIALKDRLIAKNFAQSPEKQIEYLKSQYPDMTFDMSRDGQIRIKRQGDVDWRVLDPDTGIFSKDFLADAGDVAYDIYAGATEGAAATAGALGAGSLTGGAGAIPGAMAAGGATTAANEAIRQKLGQFLGIPQDVSGRDVAIAGGVGAVAPGLLGAGPARGALPIAAGYARRAGGSMLGSLGSKMSGVPKEALMNYADPAIKSQVTQLEKEGITDFTGQALDKITNFVESNKDRAGQELVAAIEGAGRQADISPAKQAFRSRMVDRSDDMLTNADVEKNRAIQDAFERYLGSGKADDFVEIGDQVPASRAFDLQKDLKQVAKFNQDMTPADVNMKGGARDAYFALNQSLDDASEGLSTRAKDQYKAALKEEAELLPKFTGKTRADSIQKTFNELSNMDRNSRKVMQEKLSKLSDDELLDLVDESKVLSTYRFLGNPSALPISSGGQTSTTRSIPLSLAGGYVGAGLGVQSGLTGDPTVDRGVGGLIGLGLGAAAGSPAMMKRYINAMQKAGRARELISENIPMPENESLRRGLRVGIGTELMND
jgi:hypothetical protein